MRWLSVADALPLGAGRYDEFLVAFADDSGLPAMYELAHWDDRRRCFVIALSRDLDPDPIPLGSTHWIKIEDPARCPGSP